MKSATAVFFLAFATASCSLPWNKSAESPLPPPPPGASDPMPLPVTSGAKVPPSSETPTTTASGSQTVPPAWTPAGTPTVAPAPTGSASGSAILPQPAATGTVDDTEVREVMGEIDRLFDGIAGKEEGSAK